MNTYLEQFLGKKMPNLLIELNQNIKLILTEHHKNLTLLLYYLLFKSNNLPLHDDYIPF
jgi:hypothetical protein